MQIPRVESEGQFRFLTDAEFMALDAKHKARYLARAAQELEMRQRALRERTCAVKELPFCAPAV
jgi:hypothetical protein